MRTVRLSLAGAVILVLLGGLSAAVVAQMDAQPGPAVVPSRQGRTRVGSRDSGTIRLVAWRRHAGERPMGIDDAKALVRAYYETVYNARDLEAIGRYLAPGFVSAGPGGARMDHATHERTLAASLAAMPDLRLTIEEQVAEGDTVVTRWSASGTQAGPMFGIPPTGRRVTASAIHIHHLADGSIVDQWEVFDTFGVLRQLGVLPTPG
jgi:steroid delta-isomerase-like uncharacterized protein